MSLPARGGEVGGMGKRVMTFQLLLGIFRCCCRMWARKKQQEYPQHGMKTTNEDGDFAGQIKYI
jgi:hypothetical protein